MNLMHFYFLFATPINRWISWYNVAHGELCGGLTSQKKCDYKFNKEHGEADRKGYLSVLPRRNRVAGTKLDGRTPVSRAMSLLKTSVGNLFNDQEHSKLDVAC